METLENAASLLDNAESLGYSASTTRAAVRKTELKLDPLQTLADRDPVSARRKLTRLHTEIAYVASAAEEVDSTAKLISLADTSLPIVFQEARRDIKSCSRVEESMRDEALRELDTQQKRADRYIRDRYTKSLEAEYRAYRDLIRKVEAIVGRVSNRESALYTEERREQRRLERERREKEEEARRKKERERRRHDDDSGFGTGFGVGLGTGYVSGSSSPSSSNIGFGGGSFGSFGSAGSGGGSFGGW